MRRHRAIRSPAEPGLESGRRTCAPLPAGPAAGSVVLYDTRSLPRRPPNTALRGMHRNGQKSSCRHSLEFLVKGDGSPVDIGIDIVIGDSLPPRQMGGYWCRENRCIRFTRKHCGVICKNRSRHPSNDTDDTDEKYYGAGYHGNHSLIPCCTIKICSFLNTGK